MAADAAGTMDIQAFWNGRSALGAAAGSQDLTLKRLEIEAIAAHVTDGMRLLDAGCGNGVTAIELAERFDVQIVGIDFAEGMVAAAQQQIAAAEADASLMPGRITCRQADVRNLPADLGQFDLIYTERLLINLPDWSCQKTVISALAGMLNPGGALLLCESSADGLAEINRLRGALGLAAIESPWHNRYLVDREVDEANIPGLVLERREGFSATYYFLSRVVNAALADREGVEPSYDAPVNKLALDLPSIGHTAQTKLWCWRRED